MNSTKFFVILFTFISVFVFRNVEAKLAESLEILLGVKFKYFLLDHPFSGQIPISRDNYLAGFEVGLMNKKSILLVYSYTGKIFPRDTHILGSMAVNDYYDNYSILLAYTPEIISERFFGLLGIVAEYDVSKLILYKNTDMSSILDQKISVYDIYSGSPSVGVKLGFIISPFEIKTSLNIGVSFYLSLPNVYLYKDVPLDGVNKFSSVWYKLEATLYL